jgi:hypothetical protein
MSILLFPFKILAYVFSGLGSALGLVLAAIGNAIIARILIGVYAGYTGNYFIHQSTIMWIMIGAFVLTFVAAASKK